MENASHDYYDYPFPAKSLAVKKLAPLLTMIAREALKALIWFTITLLLDSVIKTNTGLGIIAHVESYGQARIIIESPVNSGFVGLSNDEPLYVIVTYPNVEGLQPIIYLDGADISDTLASTDKHSKKELTTEKYDLSSLIHRPTYSPKEHRVEAKLMGYAQDTIDTAFCVFTTCYYDSLVPRKLEDWIIKTGAWNNSEDGLVGRPTAESSSGTIIWRKYIKADSDFEFSFFAKITSENYLGGISAVLNSEYEVILGDGKNNNINLKHGDAPLVTKDLPAPLIRNASYGIRIVRLGNNLTVYLNDEPVLTCFDQWPKSSTHTKFGLRVWKGEVVFSDVRLWSPAQNTYMDE